jgi:hypothetical protein
MKKLTILLLTITLFSCQVFKKSTKEKTKEETKTETSIKVDSVAEVETEKEIVSTFTDEVKTEFFDLSEVTIFEVFNDSGEVINRTTTTKTNVKVNQFLDVRKMVSEKAKEISKTELSKVDKSKTKHELSEVKKDRKVEKTSLPNWLWVLIVIIVILFILVAVWKLKNKWLIN